jgi:glycosyltransferase involved in cell wall biosynthesis
MARIFFIAPTADSDLSARTLGLEALDTAAQAQGLTPVLVVNASLKRHEITPGRPVWGVLDRSPQSDRARTLIPARQLSQHRYDVLADRLGFICQSQDIGPGDTLCLLDAALPDLEALWQFVMTRDPARLPHLHVHLSRLYAPDLAQEAQDLCRLEDRITLLRTRFDALGLLASGTLSLSAGHPALAQRLEAAGLPVTSAPINPGFDDTPPPQSTSPALLLKTLESALLAQLSGEGADQDLLAGLQDLQQGNALMGATLFVGDPQAEEARIDLQRSGLDDMLALRVMPLSQAPAQLGRFASILHDPDLHDLTLSAGWPAGRARLGGDGNVAVTTLSAEAFVAMVQDLAQAAQVPQPKPVVLHVANAWGGQGSSHVFEAQLRYLAQRGYAVFAVHFDIDDSGFFSGEGPEAMQNTLSQLPQDGALHRWRLGRDQSVSAQEKALGLRPPYQADLLSVEGESRIARSLAVPPHLSQTLLAHEPAWALINYSQNHPLIAALGLENVPTISETHDLRTIQHAIYGNTTVDPVDYQLELENARHFDGLVFINAHEEQLAQSRFPDMKSISAFPFMLGNAATEPRPLHESIATPALRSVARSPRPGLDLVERLSGRADGASSPRKLVLFVGSRHKANVTSLDWYFANVHLPYQMADHIDLIVAGNIIDDYPETDLPGVTFLGRVDDLRALYEQVDIVLLPIREGTGLPIKVIDTLVAGKPFVCTSNAIRAISELSRAWPSQDSPADFARELRALATDPDYLAQTTARLRELCDPDDSWRDYAARWDGLVEAVTGTAPPATDPEDWHKVLVPTLPRRLPVPHARLRPGKTMTVQGSGLVWQYENLNEDQESDRFHFGAAHGRLALHFAAPPGAVQLQGILNSDQMPDTLVQFYVNGRPAGRLTTDRQYQKPFVLDAQPLHRDGSALLVIDMLLIDSTGAALEVRDKRWVALEHLTLTLTSTSAS